MNKEIFKKATMNNRLDLAEFALTLAVVNGESWAIKYMLSTQGKSRGYSETLQIENVTKAPKWEGHLSLEEELKRREIPLPNLEIEEYIEDDLETINDTTELDVDSILSEIEIDKKLLEEKLRKVKDENKRLKQPVEELILSPFGER